MVDIETELKRAIQKAFLKVELTLQESDIVIERSKEKTHGDYATNVAMKYAKVLKKTPRELATMLSSLLEHEAIEKIEIAGPGFMNFFIHPRFLSSLIETILEKADRYGTSDYGKKVRINVEFVSANPTGDLHLGHTRGAALGDSICRLYTAVGYDVTREFYVNDAGNQIENLGRSLRARYLQLHGDDLAKVPGDGYHGEDIIRIATQMKAEVGDRYLLDTEESQTYFKNRGIELELEKLKRDLDLIRVRFDTFSSEKAIRNAGGIEKVLETCKPYIYQEDGASFLKTSLYGDDKDRVIIKKTGEYTYLLPDIAYHADKLQRSYAMLVDLLGADHHGYIDRMKASLQMLGFSKDVLEIELIQMVRLFKDGQEYKMSKRTGNAVSMRELCEDVGVDAVRYFFVSRAASSHLDFDLDLAAKMESSNPVFYAQYAHARLSAVLEQGKEIPEDVSGKALQAEQEMKLLKILDDFPKEVLQAALTRAPYKVTIYIQKLATSIHEFYAHCRIVDKEQLEVTASRLALCKAAKIVLKNALGYIGVNAPERM